ncbi:hypothetical protein M8J77_019917 [Diaphorina citri]|nr:hypothetical protein M8J77_019917 [Diaphorina citri]
MWSASFVFICLLCSTNPTFGDYYSSLLNVEKLVETEDQFIKNIENYIENAEKLLEQCEKALDIWQTNHERDVANAKEFVKVPTNGFKLIKRNTVDKDIIIDRFLKPVGKGVFNMTEIMSKLPDETDLYHTSWAIAKLSFVYNMTFTSMLVDGEIGFGEEYYYHRPLRSDEIIVFLEQLYSNKFNVINHFNEDEFFYLVLGAMKDVSYSSYPVTMYHFWKMMKSLASDIVVSPFMLHALVTEVLTIYPEEPMITEIEVIVMTRIQELNSQNATRTQKYQQLCQGQGARSIKLLSTLKCYYLRYTRSLYLLIAPAKVEQLNVDPEILLFHDILTDNQMEMLKNASMPHMERSQVINSNNIARVSNIRLTHQARLYPNHTTKSVYDVQHFTEYVTGLNKDGFENFSVNIYGVGGYYVYHMDSSPQEETMRIATMLFYLSDVQLGGATVFPYFNLTVQARKGTAILWYNTHTSGEMDNRMLHSACPVLLGHKWIGTYWIRYRQQAFYRPCIPNEYHTSFDHFIENYAIIPELQQQ